MSVKGRARRGEDDVADLATAFEDVRNDLADVEALAVAASAVLAEVPRIGDAVQRRRVSRVGSLVEATARTATAALDRADATLVKMSQ